MEKPKIKVKTQYVVTIVKETRRIIEKWETVFIHKRNGIKLTISDFNRLPVDKRVDYEKGKTLNDVVELKQEIKRIKEIRLPTRTKKWRP